MGIYMYRVTSKTRKLPNGETANIAVFAYKPALSGRDADKVNSKAHFKTGCVRADALADKGKFSTWIIHGDPDAHDFTPDNAILKFDHPVGSYSDDEGTFRRYGKGKI